MQQHKEADSFHWECQPKAEALLYRLLNECCHKNHFLKKLDEEINEKTSCRLFDWLDHIEVGYSDQISSELSDAGFVSELATPMYRVFHHPGAKLPLVMVKDQSHPFVGVGIAVESIADFLMCHGLSCWIEGSPLAPFRRSCVSKEQGVFVYLIERRGVLSMEPITLRQSETDTILTCYEKWQTRPRCQDDENEEEESIRQAISLAEEIVESVGQGMAAWIVLDIERRYWQAKNTAGQIQKNRQDRLGLGWANHDHHTFRSSRRHFRHLVRLCEILGFQCRERFYAGKEAGWGAQVVENKHARLVCFLDVDLTPEELDIDFAHQLLEEQATLGTVGLWCALHGESIVKSGMHHLEAQFDFEKLQQDLLAHGVNMMAPFTKLPYLRQAFTVGEQWPVNPVRVQRLLSRGQITQEQAERFLKNGALGSHLENLERKEGYKGFNQRSVSDIIHRTDPRGA